MPSETEYETGEQEIQSDQKVSVHLMTVTLLPQHTSFMPHYLAQSDCLVADRQSQGNTRLTLPPPVSRNSTLAW